MRQRKSLIDNRFAFAMLVLLLLAGSLYGLMQIQEFTGFIGYMLNASSGTITHLIIRQQADTPYWGGYAGFFYLNLIDDLDPIQQNLTAANITIFDMEMDCFGGTGNDIYFSEYWYSDLTYPVEAATIEDLEAYIGGNLTDVLDSPRNTYTESILVNFGGKNITTIGTYTRQVGSPNGTDFNAFVLKDDTGKLLFGTHVNTLANGFDDELHNFQTMIPVPINRTYVPLFVYADPISDPFGNCSQVRNVYLDGFVTDNATGLPLGNVTVTVAAVWVTSSDEVGFYNMLVEAGKHYLVAKAEGYMDHLGIIELIYGTPLQYNFSMIPTFGLGQPSGVGFVNGTVYDNETGLPIANATVTTGVNATMSDEFGRYQVLSYNGNTTIVAFKDGYEDYVSEVEVFTLVTTYHDINMTPLASVAPPSGNVTGIVMDRSGIPIPNVTVYLASLNGSLINTDENGTYLITAPEDRYFIIAEKYGFRRYIEQVSIWRYNVTYHNITLYNISIPYCSATITHDIVGYVPEAYNFTNCPVLDVSVILNQSIDNRSITAELYTTRPEDLPLPSFMNLGKYYHFISNINQTPLENVTYTFYYNDTDIGAQFNESYITVYYFDNRTDSWLELNHTFDEYGNSTTPDLNIVNNTIQIFAGRRNFSYFVLGVRSTRVYGSTTLLGAPLPNVTVYTSGSHVVTGEGGNYSLRTSEGYHNLIAIKEGYNAYISEYNISNGQWLRKDIPMEPYVLPGLGPGDGPGDGPGLGPGQGPGLGPGTGQTAAEMPADLLMYISIDAIKKKIRGGTFVDEVLVLYNLRKEPANVRYEITGDAAPYVQLSREEAMVMPNGSTKIGIRMLGTGDPGFYTGALRISGDYNAIVPIELTIMKEGKIPLKSLILKIESLKKVVYRGEEFRYKTDLTNLLTTADFDLFLNYTLSDMNQSTNLNLGDQDVTLSTFLSLLRKGKIPDDLPLGDYVLSVDASYLGYTSTANTVVEVRDPFYKYKVFGFLPVWLLMTLIGSGLIIYFVVAIIKKEQAKKRRFNVKVEYKELPSEGPRSIFIGFIAETKHKTYLDMDNLTVHTIVAGSTGGGKSIAAQDIVEECLMKGVAVAVFDPTAQWSGMLRKLADKKFLALYANFGFDPKKDARAFPGNIKAIKDHREVVDIFKYMKAGEIQVFTTNTLDPKTYDIFVANMIRQIFHSKLDEFRGLKYLVVFDEIHRILPKFGGSGEGFLQIERGCREFRKWGIGIMLISQVLSDFVGEIKANINTQVQMKTRDEGDLNRIKMQYGEEFIQALVKAPVGSGMIQNAAYNRGRPFYVTFRPIFHSVERLKDEELEEYNKYNSIVEQMEYEFEQLEALKQDVFDLKLELKLAKDKIKGGNFNMVKIYLEGLTPRVQKIWDKLGKSPQKLQVKLVSDDELKAEMEAAKAAKKKADAENAANAATAGPAKEEEPEVKMDPKQVEENMKAVEKLFKNIEESIASKDYFAVNDRVIELQSMPLPKDKKAAVKKRIDEVNARIEALKNPQPAAAAPAAAPSPAAATTPSAAPAPAGAPAAPPAPAAQQTAAPSVK